MTARVDATRTPIWNEREWAGATPNELADSDSDSVRSTPVGCESVDSGPGRVACATGGGGA